MKVSIWGLGGGCCKRGGKWSQLTFAHPSSVWTVAVLALVPCTRREVDRVKVEAVEVVEPGIGRADRLKLRVGISQRNADEAGAARRWLGAEVLDGVTLDAKGVMKTGNSTPRKRRVRREEALQRGRRRKYLVDIPL